MMMVVAVAAMGMAVAATGVAVWHWGAHRLQEWVGHLGVVVEHDEEASL
jgi:hypothetical protein